MRQRWHCNLREPPPPWQWKASWCWKRGASSFLFTKSQFSKSHFTASILGNLSSSLQNRDSVLAGTTGKSITVKGYILVCLFEWRVTQHSQETQQCQPLLNHGKKFWTDNGLVTMNRIFFLKKFHSAPKKNSYFTILAFFKVHLGYVTVPVIPRALYTLAAAFSIQNLVIETRQLLQVPICHFKSRGGVWDLST